MNPLLTDALGYFARGWSLIPIVPQTKKAAAAWTAHQKERASEAMIRLWFDKPKYPGIGVIFGKVSGGLASRDYDNPEAYRRWAADHPDLAATLPTVETGRGFHLYFRAASERFENCGDGEYRGNSGHYSVLPPTIHPSGKPYRWMIPLPAGDLPLIDPVAVGLVFAGVFQKNDEKTTPQTNGSVISVGSVGFVHSVGSVVSVTWDDDLERTLPTDTGKRNDLTFPLARTLKARPECADASAMQLIPVLREWYRRALPKIKTKNFDETRIDFNRSWNRVKYPMGKGPIEELMQRAKGMNPPAEAQSYDSPGVKSMATLCALLQGNCGGDGVFFLSCRKAAQVMGLDNHVTANRWLSLLRDDGLLIEVEKGKLGRASRWRWTGSLVEPHGKQMAVQSNADTH